MIPQSPLFTQYKDSFLLYTFRHLDRIRASKSKQLSQILATELTYLYEIACLISYKDVQNEEIEQLKQWSLQLSHEFDVEHMKMLFKEKVQELNLRSTQPKNYLYTFHTIWDTIHFLALLIDDMVRNREKMTYDFLTNQLRQMKTLYYNLFFKLDCAMCRDHYMSVKGYLIYAIERIELCLNRERFDEKITMVDEITVHNINDNVLMKNGMLYATMVFHNHINDYRWIQRNMKPPVNFQKMNWSEYKSLLNLK
ncbi:p33 [Alphabaculovirus alterspexiguae]|uniref:p33 n=1 Tax=Spodoptera exigua multiple nucleopolyhedrovirus TaxID=10454 RepID=A0A3G2JU09_9ABAC|nr:p33 [Spodoptera exigua multiple nucleopolyhedrovirus]AYN45025.1 p33 [Spodoptera exigua multiple nucleopolyhedrovirus]